MNPSFDRHAVLPCNSAISSSMSYTTKTRLISVTDEIPYIETAVYLISYTPTLWKSTPEVSIVIDAGMFEVAPGSLNTPPIGTFMVESPLRVISGTVGSLVITMVLSTVVVSKALAAVYRTVYSRPSTLLSSMSPTMVTTAPVSVTAPASTYLVLASTG